MSFYGVQYLVLSVCVFVCLSMCWNGRLYSWILWTVNRVLEVSAEQLNYLIWAQRIIKINPRWDVSVVFCRCATQLDWYSSFYVQTKGGTTNIVTASHIRLRIFFYCTIFVFCVFFIFHLDRINSFRWKWGGVQICQGFFIKWLYVYGIVSRWRHLLIF